MVCRGNRSIFTSEDIVVVVLVGAIQDLALMWRRGRGREKEGKEGEGSRTALSSELCVYAIGKKGKSPKLKTACAHRETLLQWRPEPHETPLGHAD